MSLDAMIKQIGAPLGSAERDALANAVVGTKIYRRAETIFDSHRPASNLHVMSEGWAARSVSFKDGSRQITDFLVAGDLCDLSAVGQASVGRVAALTSANVTLLSRTALVTATASLPKLAAALLNLSLVEQSTLRVWLAYMGRHDKTTHLAHLFCELHARLRRVELVGDHSFDLPLTHEVLADATGMSGVHVNRVLQQLRQDGLISLHKRHLKILQPRELRELAEFNPAYLLG